MIIGCFFGCRTGQERKEQHHAVMTSLPRAEGRTLTKTSDGEWFSSWKSFSCRVFTAFTVGPLDKTMSRQCESRCHPRRDQGKYQSYCSQFVAWFLPFTAHRSVRVLLGAFCIILYRHIKRLHCVDGSLERSNLIDVRLLVIHAHPLSNFTIEF